jgi:NAD+ diphosphatase
MSFQFISKVNPPSENSGPAYWFVLRGFRLLVQDDEPAVSIPLTEDFPTVSRDIVRRQYLGYLKTPTGPINCYSAEVPVEEITPAGMAFLSLRKLFGRLDDTMLALAGRAVQIVEWDRTHQFCGHCGTPVQHLSHERAKKCPKCGLTSYPRLAPAIIVSIERTKVDGSEILLAHNHRHPQGFYSVLAGFVEPGESLEECVRREIREEVGIGVKNISYFGSQPWPFPNSLMIAFTADYNDGEIEIEEDEISDASWFAAGALPPVPPPISIARKLIDAFEAKNRKQS